MGYLFSVPDPGPIGTRRATSVRERVLRLCVMGRGRPRSDVEEFVAGLPDDYLQCRRFGHQTRETTAKHDRQRRIFEQGLECPRCGVWWTEQINDRTGEVIRKSQYHYEDAPEYLAPKGDGETRQGGERRGPARAGPPDLGETAPLRLLTSKQPAAPTASRPPLGRRRL